MKKNNDILFHSSINFIPKDIKKSNWQLFLLALPMSNLGEKITVIKKEF